MNKVFNINLGGYPFTIDEDAFGHLNQYLDAIHRHFESSEGYEDISSDIEDRMAELIEIPVAESEGRPALRSRTFREGKWHDGNVARITDHGMPLHLRARPIRLECR